MGIIAPPTQITGPLTITNGLGVFGHAAPVAQHGAIAATTAPGAFKKGTQGFETEAEAKAVIEKLEALNTAVNALRETLKEYGQTA